MIWILLLILLLVFAYFKLITPHSYWVKRGVKHGKPVPIVGDNYGLLLKKENLAHMVSRLYNAVPGSRYSGAYQAIKPILLLKDPDLIKQITVKDFDHFVDHVQLFPEDHEPLAARNLFNLRGDNWRDMRATLSPAFTSRKMKGMFVLMSECAEQFASYFEKQDGTQIVELKDVFSRFTNDVIASCAFGVACDSLAQRNNEFYLMGKNVTDFTGFWKSLKMSLLFTMPSVAKFFKLKLFSKESGDFFTKLVGDSIKIRKEKNIVRNDMIHLLMEAQEGRLVYEEQSQAKETGFATVEESDLGKSTTKTSKHEITLVDMTAQALAFFFAGFDAVAVLMCFIGYELGANPDIQERLRKEIDNTLRECNGKLTYEALNKMKYLDMVLSETLRKWPFAVVADRVCVKSYTVPAENPGEIPINLSVGDVIWLPIWGLHHDPQYYPEPERFDPERFSDENKANIKPYTYLPFGSGPRNCIGSRFVLLETKVMFFQLLSKMEIVVVEKTQVPLKMSTSTPNITSENGFWFGLKKRNL